MWKQPWGYKEGFTICAGLFLTGILLQITIGKVNWDLLAFPVNAILLVIFISVLIAMHLLARKVYLFRFMSRLAAAVSALIAVTGITVVMGLIRQKPFHVHLSGWESWFGFSQLLSAWPFILLFGWIITLLGMVTLRRIFSFRWNTIPFLLNHLGLFIALTAATFGNADMQRLEMTTVVGKTEWRAFDREGNMVDLPLAVELKHFTIDEYPPKLMLIDNETGKALPAGKPENLLLEDDLSEGRLLDWTIRIDRRIPEAVSVITEDTVQFAEFHSVGAAYAIYVSAVHNHTGERKDGWVSSGSFAFPYKTLRLDDNVSLIMPDREPRRYASDVVVYTESGRVEEAVIEVNKPFYMEGWKIYQLSYDESKGKWSDMSVFELVLDPWLPAVYTGIWMLIAGAVCMFIFAGKRKEDKV